MWVAKGEVRPWATREVTSRWRCTRGFPGCPGVSQPSKSPCSFEPRRNQVKFYLFLPGPARVGWGARGSGGNGPAGVWAVQARLLKRASSRAPRPLRAGPACSRNSQSHITSTWPGSCPVSPGDPARRAVTCLTDKPPNRSGDVHRRSGADIGGDPGGRGVPAGRCHWASGGVPNPECPAALKGCAFPSCWRSPPLSEGGLERRAASFLRERPRRPPPPPGHGPHLCSFFCSK